MSLPISCAADSVFASEVETAEERVGAGCGFADIELLCLCLFTAQFELQPPAM